MFIVINVHDLQVYTLLHLADISCDSSKYFAEKLWPSLKIYTTNHITVKAMKDEVTIAAEPLILESSVK